MSTIMDCNLLIKTELRTLTVSAQPGELLLDILRRAGVPVYAPCGGNGSCGKCRIMLDGVPVSACQTRIQKSGTAELSEQHGGRILTDSPVSSIPELTDPADSVPCPHAAPGLAVDLGTTTVAAELLDLRTGSRLGLASAWNAQAAYGADVITRCQYCMEHPDGLQTLHKLIRDQIASLTRQFGIDPKDLKETFVAGNTVMQHLYAGISPVGIAVAPFRPETLFDQDDPEEPGLCYAPCVAGYVGGDITAGLLASGLRRRKGCYLFLDIGTNGEMALSGPDGFCGCAVASGPAFEGVGISCGMPGVDGAVSHVRWVGDKPEYEVIGGGSPRGICGSGLIDLLACLVEKRLISSTGRLLAPDEVPHEFESRLGEDENGNGIFYLTETHDVFLTASDVRQLQLAKAAVAAGICILLKHTGITAENLDGLMLAGGFGTFMNVRSAALIGMIPACLTEKTVLLGNSSLAGARMALLHSEKRLELAEIKSAFHYLELSGHPDFNLEFPNQMYFYEEDEEEWN